MSGLFRFTGRGRDATRPSQSTRVRSDPDFSAFELDTEDDDSDNDDDRDGYSIGEHVPLHSRQQVNHNNQSRDTEGSIALDDGVEDPLTITQATNSNSGTTVAYNHATTIPGGYDFEPQPHQGGATPSHATAFNTSSNFTHSPRNSTTNTSSASVTSPYSTTLNSTANNRFTAGAIYARFAAAAGNATNQNHATRSNSNHGRQVEDDDDDEHRHETSGLLFDAAHSSTEEDHIPSNSVASGPERYPPSHVPLPARPPQFGAGAGANGRVFGGGQGNDGVFANLSAKPDGVRNGADYVGGDEGDNKDEVLPAYEVAAMDTTPPYWETTVITPGGVLGPDDICVDGLPVGNLFGFAWNLLVSMSFQFVGFLLTYLLHTTHAAKNGSRAGLGITMIQLGFYLKERADHPERFLMPGDMTGLDGSAGPGVGGVDLGAASGSNPDDPINAWSWWGGVSPEQPDIASEGTGNLATATFSAIGSLPTQIHGALSGAFDASDPDSLAALRNGSSAGMPSLTGQVSQEELMRMSAAANEWMAFMMISIGSFLIIGAVLSYWRAVRWAKAVREGNGPQQDSESLVGRILAATG